MITSPVPQVNLSVPGFPQKAVLVITLKDFDVCYASHLAVEWLNLAADRLLGRSLMLSLPALGQAISLAVSAGLSPHATSLNVAMTKPDGTRLRVNAHQLDANVIIEFDIANDRANTVKGGQKSSPTRDHPTPDLVGLQRRIDEMKQDLTALRARIPCDEAMLRGDDPILFWLWQAEAAMTQVSQRFSALCAIQRKSTGSYHRPTTS